MSPEILEAVNVALHGISPGAFRNRVGGGGDPLSINSPGSNEGVPGSLVQTSENFLIAIWNFAGGVTHSVRDEVSESLVRKGLHLNTLKGLKHTL